MDMTQVHHDILFHAWLLARENKGLVLADNVFPEADALAQAGWLERRFSPDGSVLSWWWTAAAQNAVRYGGLINVADIDGRMN
jgi:hypothetical protein